MKASVIVPLQGGPEQALRCFRSLAALPPDPQHEVIVVDDAAVGLGEVFGLLEGDVEIVRHERRAGLAASLESALPRARGEVIVLLRGAAELGAGSLAPLVRAVADGSLDLAASVDAAGGPAHPVAAHAVAVATERLRTGGVPARVADPFVIAALAADARRAALVPDSVVVPPGTRTGGARRPPGEEPELSIVIPTLDAASERVRACVAAVQGATDAPHEIVIVDNGAPPQGFAQPVNSGLRAARGRYAVVMNDDVEVLPGWWAPLRAALDEGAAVAFPLTVDGAMRRDFAAWCFAVSRAALERFAVAPGAFFDPELRVWYQDTDLLERLRAAGLPPRLVEASRIRHGLSETVATADPQLRAWIDARIARDREAFQRKHPTVSLVPL